MADVYPRLSLKPLSWRNKDGLPRLMIFRLDSPTTKYQLCRFDCCDCGLLGKWPKKIADCYEADSEDKDVIRASRKLGSLIGRRDDCFKLRYHFKGLIPPEIRAKIVVAMKIFKKRKIFIITEPQGCGTDITIKEDPLVVAWDGEHLHLIAVFDTTDVEKAMISEPAGD